jgi:hypothetical protein
MWGDIMSDSVDLMMNAFLRSFKHYKYIPKENITTYELAQIIPILITINPCSVESQINSLPDNCKRHFEEIE